MHSVLARQISSLRKNEQIVLSLYYEKELNMKEIAQVMGVSAARVSQIHSRRSSTCGRGCSSIWRPEGPAEKECHDMTKGFYNLTPVSCPRPGAWT